MQSSHDHLTGILVPGLARLDIHLDKAQLLALVEYLLLLEKWNSAYNLSGIREADKMVAYHLLDSLAIAPHIDGSNILDVGTGAGLPGIPLAICFPDKHFLLLDSNGKKTRFLFQVKTELGLDNVSVFHERVESFQSPVQIDIVLCRAFAALDRFVEQTSHILKGQGRVLAMKGQYPEAEIKRLPGSCKVVKTTAVEVPGVDGPRHLIEIAAAGAQAQPGGSKQE